MDGCVDSVGGEHEVISGKRLPSRKGGRRQLHLRWHSDGIRCYLQIPVQRPGRRQLLHILIIFDHFAPESPGSWGEARDPEWGKAQRSRFAREPIEARLTGSRNYTTCMFDICDLLDLLDLFDVYPLLSGLAGPAGWGRTARWLHQRPEVRPKCSSHSETLRISTLCANVCKFNHVSSCFIMFHDVWAWVQPSLVQFNPEQLHWPHISCNFRSGRMTDRCRSQINAANKKIDLLEQQKTLFECLVFPTGYWTQNFGWNSIGSPAQETVHARIPQEGSAPCAHLSPGFPKELLFKPVGKSANGRWANLVACYWSNWSARPTPNSAKSDLKCRLQRLGPKRDRLPNRKRAMAKKGDCNSSSQLQHLWQCTSDSAPAFGLPVQPCALVLSSRFEVLRMQLPNPDYFFSAFPQAFQLGK